MNAHNCSAEIRAAFKNLNRLEGVNGLPSMVSFLRHNRNNGNGIEGVIFEGTVARNVMDGQIPGSGQLVGISADGLPGHLRIDTVTSNWAIQVKHKQNGTFGIGDINGGGEGATTYLDELALQAQNLNKTPVLLTNQQISGPLQDELMNRNVQWVYQPN